METPDLASAEYWESDDVDIRLNPKRGCDPEGLEAFLSIRGVASSVVLPTSGSSGQAKFVVLPKHALLSSARAVNAHCGLRSADIWLAGLSTFHVGGLGIYARAFANGATVVPMRWDCWSRDGSALLSEVETSGATLTSLTPTHLHDLVEARVQCPETLRGVFLGGGRIDSNVVATASELGWPIWPTYGMTEASSQIATSSSRDVDWLPVIPGWRTRTDEDGRLAICGEALFSGYAIREADQWRFEEPFDDGWFTTGDRCEIEEGRLRFSGRADDLVKVSGEWVSLSALEDRISRSGVDAAVVALPDERRENELVAVIVADDPGAAAIMTDLNRDLPAIEQLSRFVAVDSLPRTEIGKLDRQALRRFAER